MSIWDLPIQDHEPEPDITIHGEQVGEFAEAEKKAFEPFESFVVSGCIKTAKGARENFKRSPGSFRLVDEVGCAEVRRKLRLRKAETFKLLVEAENAFDAIFSKEPWQEQPASGIHTKLINKFKKAVRG